MLFLNILTGAPYLSFLGKCGVFCFGGMIMYIAIVTHDIEYATRLISYIRYEKKHIPYSFQLFTNVDHFLHNAQKTMCQMVMIDEHLIPEYKQSKAMQLNIPMLIVTESHGDFEEAAIFKFRPASLAYNEIQKQLEQKNTIIKQEHTQVISVSSFLAGVGKTTVALALADECVKKGQQVFYLNLERWTSEDLYAPISEEHAQEANLSKLYYVLQTKSAHCSEWIKKHKFKLPQHACYTLYPFIHQDDRLKLQTEEALQLLHVIKESQLFDTIIVDLEAGYESLQVSMISQADIHFICTHASTRMQKKHVQELEHLNNQLNKEEFKKLEHAIYITQTANNTVLQTPAHPNTIYLPQLDIGQLPLQSSLYRAAIHHAMKKMGQHMELAACQ